MSTEVILTSLPEQTNPVGTDITYIVDTANNLSKFVSLANLPISTPTQTALDSKEPTITAGTTTQYYRGDKTFQTLDKAAVGLSNVDNTSDLNKPISTATQTALDAKQNTLVSGTNIKTINSTSLLGSGDISISANPSGGAGAIQFSDGSAFASDSNLFWDNTNKRLGIGESTPTATVHIQGSGNTSSTTALLVQNSSGTELMKVNNDGSLDIKQGGNNAFNVSSSRDISLRNGQAIIGNNHNSFFGNTCLGFSGSGGTSAARLHIKGSGSTSATTSLLVQNSANTSLLTIRDNGELVLGGSVGRVTSSTNDVIWTSTNNRVNGNWCVGIGNYADNSAILQADSTTKGFLPPRMTTTQKNAISSPAAGLQVYDTTLNQMSYYNGTSWVNF